MKKQPPKREKSRRIEEKDLAWAKGSSGYLISCGDDSDPDPHDPGDGGQ